MRTQDCSALRTLALAAALIAPSASGMPPSTTAPTPAAFRSIRDVQCTRNGFGHVECRVPGYARINTADTCPPHAPTFGSIRHPGGVTLLDRFPDVDARPVAMLHDRQFICIGTVVNTMLGTAMWSYVVAIPTRFIADCRGKALCRHADFPMRWARTRPSVPCHLDATGRYSKGCAAGWVRSELVDEYSMGIRSVAE